MLTFSLDSELDADSLRLVEGELRQQLDGLRLGPGAIGQAFEVRRKGIPNQRVRVRLERLPADGIAIDSRTRFTFVGEGAPSQPPDTTLRRFGDALPEIPTALREYTSALWIDSPHDRNEYERATARVAGLVGIPSGEVIADVTARLRGTEWLAGWSHRHYGTLISATADVAGATPFLLLAGDPGTGKSVLAHQLPPIIAHRLGSPVLFIQLNDKLRGTGIQGRAGTGVVTVIQEIGWLADRQRVPTVVFLDEAESVASSRRSVDGSSGSAENVAVTDALIVGLDQVFARGDARLVFVMATNLTAQVDSAVLRRATIYQFDRPSAVDRRQILLRCLGEVVDPVVLDSVNQLLDRPGLPLTAADVLNQVVGRAIREAATADRPIDLSRLADLARRAVPTAPVAAT